VILKVSREVSLCRFAGRDKRSEYIKRSSWREVRSSNALSCSSVRLTMLCPCPLIRFLNCRFVRDVSCLQKGMERTDASLATRVFSPDQISEAPY
jgi:hypothetical protein